MSKEKLVFITSGDEQIGVMVSGGDRVDSVGNVWGENGIWKSGPGFEQPAIKSMWPMFDDPIPESFKVEGHVSATFDDPEIIKSMRERAEDCPAWLPPDLFDGLVEAISERMIADAAEEEELCGKVEYAAIDIFAAIHTYRRALLQNPGEALRVELSDAAVAITNAITAYHAAADLVSGPDRSIDIEINVELNR